ncbi:hypothetical protein [Streptomyces sp. NPDC057582]|uniref:hypothetical protein n=1 Tax=Streptomyces sp. NPDC057582 TaxID=3346174 RepID=UPI00367EBB46
MAMITVVNKSTLCADEQVLNMARACALQVAHDAAPQWGQVPIPVVFLENEQQAPPGAWVIAVLDDEEQADALGWHTEDQGDKIYGRVFARPILANGGDVLSRPLSVASVLSHEVLETLVDPHVNLWADAGNGTGYALEVCDPVESDSYPIAVAGVGNVTVSNFVTPHWFDPQAADYDQFDFTGRVHKPFELTDGGYVIIRQEGKIAQQFGAGYPDWRKAMKRVDTARSARR